MPDNSANPEEISVAILASMGLFICIAVVLIFFVMYFQRKKYEHKEELLSTQEKNKRQLMQSKLEVAEQTRLYIAQELHDNISTLSSILKINIGLVLSETNEQKKIELLNQSNDLARTLTTEIKQLSVALNTDRIVQMGISQAIGMEITRIRKLNLFDVLYNVTGEEWLIPADRQIIIFRICQELLHNILKHASPQKVEVTLDFTPDRLVIDIKDNGKGFVMEDRPVPAAGTDGSGLINLPNRVKLIGGALYLDSAPGKGTHSTIQIPKLTG
jgi:signal transduction histidine kinase